MQEQIIKFETAKLAKEKGFIWDVKEAYYADKDELSKRMREECWDGYPVNTEDEAYLAAPTQEQLKKFIREERGVHIEIGRNASGYYWVMCKSDGGTDLGYSDFSGPNASGVWDKYEDAFEDALQVQLYTDLKKVKGHWSNYSEFAIKRYALK